MHFIASIILAQSVKVLSSEIDPLETHSLLLPSFTHSSHWLKNELQNLCNAQKQPSQLSFKIGVLKNFAIFTKKTLVLESLFNPSGLQIFKKRLQHMCFPVNIKNSVFIEHFWSLPLNVLIVVKQNSNFESKSTV